jgi:hypothetical protein
VWGYYSIQYLLRHSTRKNHTFSEVMNKEATIPCVLFCHRTHSDEHIALYAVCVVVLACWRMHEFSHTWIDILKLVRMCYISAWIYGPRKMGPVTLGALIAHHTSTLTSCNGCSWINMGFFADQFILFWEFTCQPMDETKLHETEWVWGLLLQHAPMKELVYKIQSFFMVCVIEFVNDCCLTWTQA